MSWRTIVIENPAKISFKDNKIVISQDEEKLLPLEDIDSLVLDGRGICLTQNVIAKLSESGVNVVVCNDKHLPSAMLTSYSQASRGVKAASAQLNMPAATRKQLWRKNIVQKITNQAMVLEIFGHKSDDLLDLARSVRSGDVGNNESTAARLYFDRLLGDSTRREPMWYNSALNYGYAIVRGEIARNVASRGLIAMVGINHHSELNQYNLVDDLVEAFRPIVDKYILEKVAIYHVDDEQDEKLTHEDRHRIIDILNENGIIYNKEYSIKHMVEKVVESFVKSILDDNVDELILPAIKK